MTLHATTVRPVVENWSNSRSTPWTNEEQVSVVEALVELSAVVTPRIVPDVPLTNERVQEIFLDRVVDGLEASLGQLAAPIRAELGVDAPTLRAGTATPALGLRSASHGELEALPVLGPVLAKEVARFLAANPGVDEHDALRSISGIGEVGVDTLRPLTYFDRPRQLLVSPTKWAFALEPSVETFLALFDATDLVFVRGDQNTVARRLTSQSNGSTAARFATFIQELDSRARLRSSAVDGILASAAERRLRRHAKRKVLLAATTNVSGGLLVNSDYVDAVAGAIEAATVSLSLMVFLGTASTGTTDGPGPLRLIEAMEAAAARGVNVRVVLDQDDGGQPYKSVWINRPLAERLATSGVEVRFDQKDVLLHSKVLVVDDEVAVVGSHNWTRAGFNDTHELSVLLRGQTIARAFGERFDALWTSLEPT